MKNFKFFFAISLSLFAYWLIPESKIDGIPRGQYRQIVSSYDTLCSKYKAYKNQGRRRGYIEPEEIDELRNVFAVLNAHAARQVYASSGIPASICLSQAMLESDAGTSVLFDTTGNYFGIKCKDHAKKECRNKSYKCCVQYKDDYSWDHFRVCTDKQASFAMYVKLLKDNPRYAGCFTCNGDYKCWADSLQAAGYATDTTYATQLKGLIERYDLSRFDKPGYKFTKSELQKLTGKNNKKP